MKTMCKRLAILVLALSALGVSAPAVLAAQPLNDTFGGATPVIVGFSEVLDTTEATTDGDDAQLNACFSATDASVWYALDGTDALVVVDVSQSDYSAGVLVGVGSQGNLEFVTCGSGSVAFFAAAGTTYYVLAIDDQSDGSGNGGSLSISFNEVPLPTVDITVNRDGQVNARTGVATVSGTYTCTNSDFIDVFVDARQNVGRIFTISGFFSFVDSGTCDGVPHTWAADVFPQNGKFAGGKMMTMTSAVSCDPFFFFLCADGFVEQTVQLRGGSK